MKMRKKTSIFSEAGIGAGIICSLYGVISIIAFRSALPASSFGADFYTYMYRSVYEFYQKATITAGIAMILLGVIVICYFGNHLYKYEPINVVDDDEETDSIEKV